MTTGNPRNHVEKEINQLEDQIYQLKQKLKGIVDELPPEKIDDYSLLLLNGKEIRLSEMFGKNKEMILIHNMGIGCAYCTLWADGLNGMTAYLEDRCAFWLESDVDPVKLNDFVKRRGWKFNVVSSLNSPLKKDLGYQEEDEGKIQNMPGFSTLFLEDGKIYRHATEPFGPGDDYCGLWPMFERLKSGINDWQPKFNNAH